MSLQWVQPSSDEPLELQYEGNAVLKISKVGQLLAPAPLYSDVPPHEEHTGNILVVTQNGQVQRSPYSLKAFGDEINGHFEKIQDEINKALFDLQKNNEKIINGLVSEANTSITNVQNNSIHRMDALERNTKLVPNKIKQLETMNTALIICIIILFFLIGAILFISSKRQK